MLNLDVIYFAPVPAKIALARDLYQQFGGELAADPTVKAHLALVAARGEGLAHEFARLELGRLCGECGSGPGGGCCSGYMANETDAILLLINLLAGKTVERVREDEDECCFLGARGCILQPKPIFCLNYNCRRILALAIGRVATLISAAGAVLRAQTELEEYLLARLQVRRR